MICESFHLVPDVNLFGFWLNHKVQKYVSWKPDPDDSQVDALSTVSKIYSTVYIFPSFSMWGRLIKYIMSHYGVVNNMIVVFPDDQDSTGMHD